MPFGVTVDACVLIDFMRARDKSNTLYRKLACNGTPLYISTVVLFEVRTGLNESNQERILDILTEVRCLSFDARIAEIAADLSIKLRKNRIQVERSDLFIAATAMVHKLPLATLNRRHFNGIDGLTLFDDNRSQP